MGVYVSVQGVRKQGAQASIAKPHGEGFVTPCEVSVDRAAISPIYYAYPSSTVLLSTKCVMSTPFAG